MQGTVRAVRAVLWMQIVLAVGALVLAVLALLVGDDMRTTSQGVTVVGGAIVSSSVLIYGVLLILLAVLGLIAVRRRDRVWFLRAGIALLAPVVVAVVSIAFPGEQYVGVQEFVSLGAWAGIEIMLRLMEFASWMILAAMVLATLSAVLLLQLSRKAVST